ncbi:MAG TPA: hypothetical protein VNI77_08290, partial [Nitrososphaera sp.]|nr:hypothetical protein [Nitrososphaera sp.]
ATLGFTTSRGHIRVWAIERQRRFILVYEKCPPYFSRILVWTLGTSILDGLSRVEAEQALRDNGFKAKAPSPRGYVEWTHSDGSRVTIKPDGEIVRSASPQAARDAGYPGRKGVQINPQTGEVGRPHSFPRERIK